MTDIGRAGMVMKGDYNSASTYETLDAVSYQNGLYVAKQNVPAGTVPTNTTYWQLAINDAAIGNLNTLTTIDKSSLVNAVNEINGNLGARFKVVTSRVGSFDGIIGNEEVWLVIGNRISTSSFLMMLVSRYNNSVSVQEINKGNGITYITNDQGSIQIYYDNEIVLGMYACAIRLY